MMSMVMEEQEKICTLCKEKVVYGRDGQVVCWFIGQPDIEKRCPVGKQSVNLAPLIEPHPVVDETAQELLSRQKTISNLPTGANITSDNAAQELLSRQKTIPYSPPDKPSQERAFYQEATRSLPPFEVPEPSPPSNPFLPPEPPQLPLPSLPSIVTPPKRRGRWLLSSLVILLLLISSGVLAYYSFQLHSQILSLNSKISTQAATIQNQSTAIQRGQVALTATIQTVIQNGQATQAALGQQLSNLQATSTAVAMNAQLGAFFVKQSSYPTISVTQSVSISFTLLNSGTIPWSNQGGFTFKCTSITRTGPLPNSAWKPVCPNPGTITIDKAPNVPIGKQYTFSFVFSPSALSLSAGNVYVTFWQLDYKGTLFGPEVYVPVTVN
jgi:hypothetical protein